MKTAILIVAVSLLTYETLFAQELLVADGEIVSTEEAPWVGFLSAGSGRCTSVYIGEGWVLTAAHCVSGVDKKDLAVGFNIDNTCEPLYSHQMYDIAEVRIHPLFNSIYNCNDLALLKLKETIDVSAITYGEYESGKDVFVFGFGDSESDDTSCELRRGNLGPESEGMNIYFCLNTLAFIFGESGSRAGDSGGPLVIYTEPENKPLLVGIVSSGLKYGTGSNYSFGTNVYRYRDWIEATTSGLIYIIPRRTTTDALMNAGYYVGQITAVVWVAYLGYKGVKMIGKGIYNRLRPAPIRSLDVRYHPVPCGDPTDYFPSK